MVKRGVVRKFLRARDAPVVRRLVDALSCLPKDEYETWLSTVKAMFVTLTGALFLKWAQAQREKLNGKFNAAVDDFPE